MSSLSRKHIPTILGLIILIAGLVGGVFLVRSSNTNSFLPRASPQTTPKSLKITNVTDTSFTVSWITDSATVGYLKYGTNATALTTTINDDRDQSTGTTGLFKTHHVTVRSLTGKTTYFFKIGTGTSELYDNNGTPYSVSTVSSVSSQARTIYGEVSLPSGAPAGGALVYVSSDTIAPMSALVQSSGSWVLSLSQARTKDLSGAATIDSTTPLSLLVLSPSDTTTSVVTTTLSNAQPVPQVTLGSNQDFSSAQTSTSLTPTPTPDLSVPATPAPESVQSKFSSSLLAPPTEATVTNGLTISNPVTDADIVSVNLPQLRGTAPAGTKVTLSLKGKTTQTNTPTADPSGLWTWTPLSKLTNGAYTLTASATIDGKKQSVVRTFTVDLSQAGTIPSITASDSASLTPTPLPTPIIVASSTPLATGSTVVSHPSTSSGTPVTGSVTPTLVMVMMGIALLLVGTGLWVFL